MNGVFVRTDLIDPHTYLELEMNYKDLIEKIYNCGGYCLYSQIYKFFGNKNTGYTHIKKLLDLLLVGSEQFNNNKYLNLKITSLRYLLYREREKEDEKRINNRLLQKPGHLPLFNSFYSFEMMLEKGYIVNTDMSIKYLRIYVNKIKSFLNSKERLKYLHLVKIENDDYIKRLETTLKIMGDRNSIFLSNFKEDDELSNCILSFIVFDVGLINENIVLKTLKHISRYLNKFGEKNLFNVCKFKLEIISTRSKKEPIEKLIDKATRTIQNRNKDVKQIRHKNNPIISNVEGVTVCSLNDLEAYIFKTNKHYEP